MTFLTEIDTGVGLGVGAGFDPRGGPSELAINSCDVSGHIARSFASVNATVGTGPVRLGAEGTFRSGNIDQHGGDESSGSIISPIGTDSGGFGGGIGGSTGVEFGAFGRY